MPTDPTDLAALAAADPGPALTTALAAADWPTVLDLIESQWRALLFRHPFDLARAALTIPPDWLTDRPIVAAVRATVPGVPFDPVSAPTVALRTAAELAAIARTPDAARELDLRIVVGSMYRTKGYVDRAAPVTEQIPLLLRAVEAAGSGGDGVVRGRMAGAYNQVGLLRLVRGDYPGATESFLDAYRVAPSSDVASSTRDAAGKVALVYALRGENAEAERWLERFRAASPQDGMISQLIESGAQIAEVLLAADALDADRSRAAFDRLEPGPLNDELAPFGEYARALFALAWSGRVGQLDELNQNVAARAPFFEQSRRSGGIVTHLLAAAAANLLLSVGRATPAWATLSYGAVEHPVLDAARARVTLLAGNPGGALDIATAANARPPDRAQQLDLRLLAAVALHRLGRDPEATQALTDSLALAGPDRLLPFAFVPRRDLIELIAAVPAAKALLSDEVMARLPDIFAAEVTVIELTGQEQAVLTGLADGKSTTDLAAEMHLSEGTVKSHRRNLYRKLGVSSRSAAVIAAAELGLLGGSSAA